MSLRKSVKKWLYGKCPGFAGAFPYFGTRVHFPRNAFVFEIACDEGIYEQHLLDQILGAIEPGSWYFDVGSNVGLMSVPVLYTLKDVRVLSFEPSPNSFPHLKKTWEGSPWKDRWTLVSKAAGDRVGETEYSLSEATHAGYDGMKPTNRVKSVASRTVPVTTLDAEWKALGLPPVSCIKMDIEGAEMQAIAGGRELIAAMRPYIFLEWYEQNFKCFGNEAGDLLEAAERFDYDVVAEPNLSVIRSARVLAMQMRRTAAFVMVPRDTPGQQLPETLAAARGRA